ncbi:choice-of-anchor B family protein [Exilibacterium tricleocarpae]|uniref:Choice-of-anchor B family protein n=1 Tax=Exilibacterium tricleocarpae TaxID=2591008 RepID=A0A545TNS7_9GAMM|nr:choice-of-anchor B family protein [Exilibacterium tricleocarpae]TQV78874.1 choice-of-anchor B family protein [Exilibacterium tricleocarpae]
MKRLGCGCFSVLSVVFASAAFSHSAMFPDLFKFDDTDEGQPSLMLQGLAQGDLSAAAAATCTSGSANGYPCSKIDFQSFLAKADMGGGSGNLNDIWGWTDPVTGREFALVGRVAGTSFVDVTDARNPVFMGYLPAHDFGSDPWRDIKVYNDHAFIVADGSGNATHGLQVFDLNTLRTITTPGGTLSETAHLGGFGPAHNIAINEDTGYAYIVGSNRCSGGLYMVDISNPAAPSFAGCFSSDGYTHDTQCVVYAGPDATYRGREICIGYNEDTITIVDVTNKSNPVQISRTGYSGSRYTHQGWFLNDNHELLIMNDEQDELRNGINTTSYIWNLFDLDNPVEIGRYVGPSRAIDHNLYTKDNYIFEANYRAGLRILASDDIANGNLTEVAFFDTIPGSDSAQFSGAWSSYVYFESGNIILSDIGNGLFVVTPDWDAINGPPPGDCLYEASFESSADGWSDGNSSCSTGTFVRGTPTQTSSGSITLQVAGAAAGSGAWFTAPNSSLGSNDVDGGTCETLSPAVDASGEQGVRISTAYFHGQRDAGDDGADGFTIEVLNNGVVVDTLVSVGDVTSSAAWATASTTLANPGVVQLRVRATDGVSNGDIVEAGLDQVSVCATTPAPTCTVTESFESGAAGWRNAATSTCSTGSYVADTPTQQANGGVTTQVGGANSGSRAYFTATNSSAGADDVDGGNCTALSPTYSVARDSTLNIAYFHGQRTAGDDAQDFFDLALSTDGGVTFNTLVSNGDSTSNAAWANTSAPVAAGADVVLRIQCSDGAGTGDLVECGIDDLAICPN